MSFERYKKDIQRLVKAGDILTSTFVFEVMPHKKEKLIKEHDFTEESLSKLPKFGDEYQTWYSEALACIRQLMPDRLSDFTEFYTPSRTRKEITNANYTISDALRGLSGSRGNQEVFGLTAAIQPLEQQVRIVKALEKRFESSLFDIQALVQAELFDNELQASEELNKKGFHRGAGAMAGVVLEGHLRTVCAQHNVSAPKNATLGKLNDALKNAGTLDTPTWRAIQHLIDLRNLCDHKKEKDPTKEQIEDLISGVKKITKTVF